MGQNGNTRPSGTRIRKTIMSGYADDFSKSNNALLAEDGGRFPATVLAKRLGVKTGAIKALMRTHEWHHASKYYNAVAYYDEETAIEMIDELKAWKPPVVGVVDLGLISGEFLEWSGTRNHPRATKVRFERVSATRKGDWITFTFNGSTVRKNVSTKGFIFTKVKP